MLDESVAALWSSAVSAHPDRQVEATGGDVAITGGGEKGSNDQVGLGPFLSIDDAHGVQAPVGLASAHARVK